MKDRRRLAREIVEEVAAPGRPLEAEEVLFVAEQLALLPDAAPSEEMTRALVASLRPLVPQARFRDQLRARRTGVISRAATLVAAVAPQAGMLGKAFWVVSAFLAAAGFVAGVLLAPESALGLLTVAPLLAVVGVAVAFRGVRTGLWEAEQSCPYDPLTLVLARFVVVLGNNLMIMTAVLPAARLAGVDSGIGALLLTWLAPALFLSTVTLLASIRWDGVTGGILGLVAWGFLAWAHSLPVQFDALALPGAEGWALGKAALLAVTAGAWISLLRQQLWRRYLELGNA